MQKLSLPAIAQRRRPIEHRMRGAPIDAIGDEVTEALELIRRLGSRIETGLANTALGAGPRVA